MMVMMKNLMDALIVYIHVLKIVKIVFKVNVLINARMDIIQLMENVLLCVEIPL